MLRGMGKVIKKSVAELGDISPDTGLADITSGAKVISGRKFEAKAEAQNIVEQGEQQAAAIVQQAQSQAQEIVQAAGVEAEKLKEEAGKRGYEEGRQKGASELSEVVAKAARRFQQIEAQAIPQLRDLALGIARKVLGKELETHPELIVDIIKQALVEKARQRREIFLRVNPDDLAAIREHKAELLEVLSRCKEIGLREDPEIARYGVVIETEAGMIDAQLETQLAVFERILKNN